jgi:signal transduction histidine kinase
MDFQRVRLAKILHDFTERIMSGNFDLEIQTNIEGSTKTIFADPLRLVQVLDNLLTNAEKYAPGSIVTISLEWDEDRAHILVSDTGPGIPQEHLKDVFKRFYRLPEHRDNHTGTGLGLFICHQIVQAHGGEIIAESAPGKGMSVHVFLPRQRLSQSQERNI